MGAPYQIQPWDIDPARCEAPEGGGMTLPAPTLDLYPRMSFVPVVNRTLPVVTDTEFTRSTGEVLVPERWSFAEIEIAGAPPAIGDVKIETAARGTWNSRSYQLQVFFVADDDTETLIWVALRGGAVEHPLYPPCPDELLEGVPLMIAEDDWNDLVAGQRTVRIRAYGTWPRESDVEDPDWAELCDTSAVSLTMSYIQRTSTDTWTWFVELATRHKTLVADPVLREPRGIPHWHRGKFVINRRTSKLIVQSRSGRGQVTLSGGGSTPANDAGNRIHTRPLPGAWESVTTGRLLGTAVRFTADGNCVPV